MSGFKSLLAGAAFYITLVSVHAQSTTTTASSATCSSSIAPQHAQPSVAPGWQVQVVASGLRDPRGIIFDQEGHLLVVEQGHGIKSLTLSGDGACVRAASEQQIVVDNSDLNHGIEFSTDGRTLYASTPSEVFAWDYDGNRTTSEPREVINQLGGTGHVTRTLMMSRRVEGMLLVSRGSMGNLDLAALNISSGVSTIKAFNITNATDSAHSYLEDGLLLGWGLRNSVGVAEDPVTGGIYSVENSVDDFVRAGENIHENNPGEELNFHGYLNGTETEQQGGNYGYPSCYAAWDVDEIPNHAGLQVGMQFAIGDQNATVNDTFCQQDRVAPRLTFPAHMAPLDIKFNSNGSAAWVSFHGSWNRDEPQGYKLSVVGFRNGEPTEPSLSKTAAIDIVSNPDLSHCPDECFRPVGLAFDNQGRLFMSSDSTGEIYVVVRADGSPADEASPGSGLPSSASGTSAAPSPTNSQSAAGMNRGGVRHFAALFAGVMALALM